MESLSRAFHRKNLRSFSAYDDVFSGGDRGRRGGAPATQIEDYMEIFRGSSSSIPVLDLSALDGAADVVEARGSSKKFDYSKIFGGFRGDDVADSYEAVFAKRSPTKTSLSDLSTRPGNQKDGDYQRGKSNKSLESVKQYNTFYNRTSQISKDGENGTTHVAQIRAVPGFTCFIDENVQKTEGDKLESLPKDKIQTSSSELNKKQTTDGTKILRSHPSWDKLNSVDRNADTNGSSVKTASFKLSSPTRASSASEMKRLGELNSNVPKSGVLKSDPGDCSPSFSDEEQDVDSAAAVSAAALRKAVWEAEASIRLAKEIMERTKNGLQKFPKPRSKEGLDMKKKKVVKTSIQAIRTETVSLNLKEIEQIGMENKGVRETDGAKSNSSDDGQVHITKLERKKARRSGKVVSSFMQSEENCVIENVSGKGNEEKLEMSDSKAPAQFPELLITDNQKKEKLYLEHTNSSNIRLFDGNVSGKVKEDKWENSAHARAPEQFPELVEAQNQRLPNFGLGHADDNSIAPSVSSGSEKANEEKSEPSADSKSLGKLPELVKVENQRAANFDVGQANGEDIMPFVHRVCGEVNEAQLELSASFNVVPQFPESVKSENSRTANLKSEHANGNNIMPSFLNLFGKIKEKLELSFDSITLGQFPEFMKTDNQKTVALELEDTSSNIRPSVHNLSKEVNEKLETSADSESLGQFLELVKTDDQRTPTLELDDTNGNNIKPSVPNLSEEVNEKLETSADSEALGQFPELVKTDNGSDIRPSIPNLPEDINEKLETSADSEALGQFPELVKTDNQRTETLELDNTNGSNIRLPVPNLSEEVNEKLETSADSEEPGQFPQLVKTDNQRTATLELDYTNGSNIRQSVHNLSEKVDYDKLEISADSEAPGQFSELVKTDDQSTAILELEHINGSNITVSTDNPIKISNEEKLESYIDKKAQEKIPELVKIDNQRTASLELEPPNGINNGPSVHLYSEKVNKMEASTNSVLDLECTNSSNFSPSVHNVPREVNENKVEPSADSKAVGEFPELGETCNCGSTSSELGQKTGINMKLPVHTNECGEMENQTNGGTLELLERHSKEIHRKRKQWKDFEGKPSDIKIAEEEGQSVHDTTPKEVHEREERRSESFEAHTKEIYRKRRQWKDVEIKPSDIRIADGGETYIHGQEKGEKITDVLDNKDVEGKQEASSSEESYVKEVKTQDQEKNVSFESLSVQSNHSEKVDEARKSIQECSKETESTMALNGVHEEEESVKHMCKNSVNEEIQESSEWRDYVEHGQNDDKEREMMNHNGNSDAWKEDRSEHLGDITSEGSERMSDASQSSFDYKEDFGFDEEVGETSEVFQSCEFKANQLIEEPIEHEAALTENTYSHHFDDFPENVGSNDEDAADIYRNDSELANNMSAGFKDSEQRQEEDNVFDFETSKIFKGDGEARGVYEEEKISGTGEVQEKTANKSVQKQIKDDETSKREREREKNRIVVERAIREARERAFAEARERVERAAVEKATAEARERVMAEARQKFEKTNSATKSSTERVSIAKLRSERAAVERAHAEARERALEKALSQKSNSNIPSSKLEANNGETAERRNARLERTQRTMERAAKALAEKNMRDLRAQREQAERHRLAETLDAEIKRWSSGKTGNLRALLSTLQYILGPDSGWQPVSLTEIVTTSAVKKAYRKATLHVHPDKLQQRGASMQQKYICEKVFDLLKVRPSPFDL